MKRRDRVLLGGIAFGMLVLSVLLIVPQATRRNFSEPAAYGLAVFLWACGILTLWTCLRSRRRRRSSSEHVTTHTDYSEIEE